MGAAERGERLLARLRGRVEAVEAQLVEARRGAEPAAPDGILDARAVHAIRVHCKVLRAGWHLLAPALGSAAAREPERALRDAARSLRADREARVLRDTLIRVVKRRARAGETDALERLMDEIRTRHPTAGESVPVPPELAATFAAQREALEAVTDPVSPDALREGLLESYRRARRFGRRADGGGGRADEAWHRCRRWVKYELYQRDLLAGDETDRGRRRRRLDRLGRELGRFQDLCDLRALVRAAEDTLAAAGALETVTIVLGREDRQLRRRMSRRFR
ncbi:MAG: CHAD domain-containing protein, partial [Pseudomonadales bacterium]|nr:CHAD domain-containing protein [Pseudomonadales bacterium]